MNTIVATAKILFNYTATNMAICKSLLRRC